MQATATRTRHAVTAQVAAEPVNQADPKPVNLSISEEECMDGFLVKKEFEITPGEPVVIQFLGHRLQFNLTPADGQ